MSPLKTRAQRMKLIFRVYVSLVAAVVAGCTLIPLYGVYGWLGALVGLAVLISLSAICAGLVWLVRLIGDWAYRGEPE